MAPFDIAGHVASIRLDAIPEPREWMRALDAPLDDPGVRVVLIDLGGANAAEATWDLAACDTLRLWRKPTVVALQGTLSGDALAFALACDVRTAAPGSMLEFDDASRELLATLVRDVGAVAGVARMDAAEALRTGLVYSVAGDPLAEARRIAGVIASRGPIATQLGKEAVWRGIRLPLAHALRFETDLTLLLQTTKDRAEGVAAFLEKREPHFTGS